MIHYHDHAHPKVSDRPMSRRGLLKALAASSVAVGVGAALAAPTAAAAAGPSVATASGPGLGGGQRLVPVNRIGIQLFTVSSRINAVGFRKVFEELSSIGFSEVEFAGYTQGSVGAITVQEIRQALDDNGLRAVGCHTTLNAGTIDQQIENGLILGMPAIGSSGPGQVTSTNAPSGSTASWQAGADLWNQMGEKAVAAGLGPIYAHNHTGEFAFLNDDPTRRVYDLLWDEYDPRYAAFQMDIYWAYAAAWQHRSTNLDPLEYIRRDPRRFQRFHLKDGKLNPNSNNGYDIVAFGEGDIPYQEFLSTLRDRGQRAGIYEQDNAGSWSGSTAPTNGEKAIAAAAYSYDNVAALRG